MRLETRKASVLLASLLFGTFGLHAVYRAHAKTSPDGANGGPDLVAASLAPNGASIITSSADPARVEAAEGGVHLTARIDRGAVLRASDGLVNLEVTIGADALPAMSERTPTDLVVVLDHSGSMHGQKLDYAKDALRGLIERVGPDDRLAVVLFDDSTQVLFPLQSPSAANRDAWRAHVRSIETGGGTSIGAGLDAGLRVISEPSKDRTTRVLLLSDGQDPSRDLVQRARAITSRNAVLSSLGIGQDFDERVMTSLATAGTGAFYYLAKPEVLPAMLDAELRTATETYANGAELHLRVAEGVRVVGAGGIPVTTRGADVVVPIGSLYAARERKLWLSLRVPTDASVERALGEVSLRYRRRGANVELAGGALPKVVCVTDPSSYEAKIDAAVWGRAMLEEELSRAREELGDAIASGTAADVDRSVARVEGQRQLAERLGQAHVVREMTALRALGSDAKLAQQAPPEARNLAAKRQKALGYGKRNASSYGATDFSTGF